MAALALGITQHARLQGWQASENEKSTTGAERVSNMSYGRMNHTWYRTQLSAAVSDLTEASEIVDVRYSGNLGSCFCVQLAGHVKPVVIAPALGFDETFLQVRLEL